MNNRKKRIPILFVKSHDDKQNATTTTTATTIDDAFKAIVWIVKRLKGNNTLGMRKKVALCFRITCDCVLCAKSESERSEHEKERRIKNWGEKMCETSG